MAKKVLITGGTGFVGANLARSFLSAGDEVHLLVRESHQTWRLADVASGLRVHTVDLCDSESADRLFQAIRPDWVFHLAAQGAYSWQDDLQSILQTNILGTANLLQAAVRSGVESFINTGSSSEYGLKDFAPAENTVLEPNSYYSVAKAATTHLGCYMAERFKMNICTLRLYSVYGPYEEPKRLIPAVIVNGLQGKLPPLANPDIARDYVHVDDVVTACVLAAQQPEKAAGAVYNVGTAQQTALREVISIAQQVLPITETPAWGSMANRAWDTTVWVADNRKIRQELGWNPASDFRVGFEKTVAWYQASLLTQRHYVPQLCPQKASSG